MLTSDRTLTALRRPAAVDSARTSGYLPDFSIQSSSAGLPILDQEQLRRSSGKLRHLWQKRQVRRPQTGEQQEDNVRKKYAQRIAYDANIQDRGQMDIRP